MPTLIAAPTLIQSAGNKPKQIAEHVGRVNSGHRHLSVARMVSPAGWEEPGQRPEFEEITLVLRGMVRVEHDGGTLDVRAGQAVVTHPGEWVNTAVRRPTAPNTSRSACRRFPWRTCTAIRCDPCPGCSIRNSLKSRTNAILKIVTACLIPPVADPWPEAS